MCVSKVQHMTGQKAGFFWFFDFLTNIATGNWKISEFVQPQLVVRSFSVGFSSISVFFPVQWTGPANTSWQWLLPRNIVYRRRIGAVDDDNFILFVDFSHAQIR